MVQSTASDGLAQGPYVVAGVGFEPATLQMQATEPTTEPPRPTCIPLVLDTGRTEDLELGQPYDIAGHDAALVIKLLPCS